MRGTGVRARWSRGPIPHPGTRKDIAPWSPQASLKNQAALRTLSRHPLLPSVPLFLKTPSAHSAQQDTPALTYSSSLSHHLSLQGKGSTLSALSGCVTMDKSLPLSELHPPTLTFPSIMQQIPWSTQFLRPGHSPEGLKA